MRSQRKSVDFFNGTLSYLKIGKGEKTILVFHGFGQNASEFSQYVEKLGENYTIYVFDHFYHGDSKWNSEDPIQVNDFAKIFVLFFEQEKITTFNIVAYSLGGKWAHSVVRFFSEQVEKVFLCAPDGSKSTFYYAFSSRNTFGRWVFKKTIQHSRFFFLLLKSLYKLGILNKSIYRFVYYQMGSVEKRKQVYNTWTKYRYFKGLSPISIGLYNKQKIPLQILLGTYDRVIQPKWFSVYTKKIILLELISVTKGHRSILTSISSRAHDFFNHE